jgi:P4 family phage/plasmid primase-like protien
MSEAKIAPKEMLDDLNFFIAPHKDPYMRLKSQPIIDISGQKIATKEMLDELILSNAPYQDSSMRIKNQPVINMSDLLAPTPPAPVAVTKQVPALVAKQVSVIKSNHIPIVKPSGIATPADLIIDQDDSRNEIIQKVVSQIEKIQNGPPSPDEFSLDNNSKSLDDNSIPVVTPIKLHQLTLNVQPKSAPYDIQMNLPAPVIKALSGIHDDVADMCVKKIEGFVYCTDIKHKIIWYWSEGTKLWVEGGLETLSNIIMMTIRPEIEKFCIFQRDKYNSTGSEKDQLILINLRKMTDKLGTLSYCNSLSTIIKERIYNPNFVNRLDSNDDVFAIKDKRILNFRTREVRDRVKEDYCTFESPVEYDPNAKSDKIDRFLDDITVSRKDLLSFLQLIFGLCLTGHIFNRSIYVMFGSRGFNGKTTLIKMLDKILGDYFKQADRQVFLKVTGNGKNIDPFIAELRGTRAAIFSEVDDGDKINESIIKMFTGGDKMKGKALYKSPIQFDPHCKCFIATNRKPECSTDAALWARLLMIPFDCYYTSTPNPNNSYERMIDLRFKDEIINDETAMKAFFRWLVDGACRCYIEPIVPPQCVVDATKEYKDEQNIYEQFVNDRIQIDTDPNSNWVITGAALYAEFRDWCIGEQGIKCPTNSTFGTNIKKILTNYTKSRGCIVYKGYRLPSLGPI